MKIAVFSDLFLPQINGVVTHLVDSINALSFHHEIIVFVPRPSKKQQLQTIISQFEKNIKIIFLPSLRFPIYEHWRITMPYNTVVSTVLSDFKPDIIHFHSPFTVGANAVFYAKKNHIPLVGTFHGYFMEPEYLAVIGLDKVGLHKSKILNQLLWSYSNFFFNKANMVICPSSVTKDDLIKHSISKPIEVVSNGIDLSRLNQKSTKRVKFPNLPPSYFLYVGRISKEKSIDIIIEALALCQKTINNQLVIVGSGPETNRLMLLSTKLGIEKKVHFIGRVDHAQLILCDIYTNAMCFISASTSETQGITILEAMAAGLPIIGVNAKATPELIDDNGILCNPHDVSNIAKAMTILSTNKKLRENYGKNSLKLVKMHSIEKTISKLEKIYQNLIP